MAKAFDPTKFRTSLTKSITGMSAGFNDPTDWISTGNYALNYLISGDWNKGIPLGKVSVFAGESGAGKSYICSGNIVKSAQDQGIFVVLIDSENALDEAWLQALDVDTSEDKLLKLNMSMIDDVAKTISTFMSDYKAMNEEDRPKVLFVVDSLGMLLTVRGIRAACKVMKTRYAKPFEGVQVKIPYETGMNPYSGLLELFEAKGVIVKQGNRLKYETLDGEELLEYRKNWTGDLLDKVMSDYLVKEAQVVNTSDEDIDVEVDDIQPIEEATTNE
jgi:RecA/RadA recombinase